MLFSDLLRITVLLVAGVATALGAISVLLAQQEDPSTFAIAMLGAWWVIAIAMGLAMGTSARAAEALSPALRSARTQTALPAESEGRIAFTRLWPIAAFAMVCVVAGIFYPQIAAIGAGYAILTALAWRRREAAVQAIEDRDGVRFYVEQSPAHRPVKLVRTPGLYRDRSP
ncbi:MAG TPA: hypothetical protein VD766_01820, partial [Solirubrobacterales bacterium]|nr:hypothetical protein [Solirubrobacterales bacterium]